MKDVEKAGGVEGLLVSFGTASLALIR
jgi:hypothetical protein